MAALVAHPPRIVVHIGFAGALRTGVTAGGLLLVTAVSKGVHAVDGPPAAAPAAVELDAELVGELRRTLAMLPDRLAQGALLTVDRLVDRASLKGELGRATSYLACDMEAAIVRQACEEAGVRYIGVRAISDAEHESVPPMLLKSALRDVAALRRAGRWALRAAAPLEAFNLFQGGRRARRGLARAIPLTLDVAHAAAAALG
jgi:nucleoside phosphorylase